MKTQKTYLYSKPNSNFSFKYYKGITLVELLITLAIAGVVLTMAIPNFQSMVVTNRLSTQINNFKGALDYSRSEAVKRGQTVTLKPTTSSNWISGWKINSSSETIFLSDAFTGQTILKNISTTSSQIDFNSDGRINSTSDIVFSLCDSTKTEAHKGKSITLSLTGKSYIESNYSCAATTTG
jgi:type IV fimbrial biogenesis protein FimT